MNLNLASPHGTKCSPPVNPVISFFSPHSSDFHFDNDFDLLWQSNLKSVSSTWTLHRNGFSTPFKEGKADANLSNRYSTRIDTSELFPGFYDLKISVDLGNGKFETSSTTFAYKADEMFLYDSKPADFQEFWQKAKEEIDQVNLDARYESQLETFDEQAINTYNLAHSALPESYDPDGITHPTVDSQKVSFAGPDNGRVYGWLAKPQGEGPFPAMLILPGAGIAARPRPLEHARHGYLSLDIQIHGQDCCTDNYPQIDGYGKNEDFSAPKNFYYYKVHQRVLQALNYLDQRPDVDSSKIVVVGGSQGGRLSTVAASIDKRVAATIPCITHNGNHPYFTHAWKSNEAKNHGMDSETFDYDKSEENLCLAYYDVMNFSADIECPVLMNMGITDPVSWASHVYAVYKNLNCQKQIITLPNLAHDWCAEFDRRAWIWLKETLGEK
ncbi:acetylxylan esterase [Lentisphaera profundi]|uniref:Acetylxylan esterase n=1 Tax=Lentisphaera profundi TaxID=1658616 RepID=A0ABY7VN51_9BACT|nr:acetylxylan esterase [Lentisphaera profundi]WDE95297.1 acetylxylan esterase [Lentisphaera profundi]